MDRVLFYAGDPSAYVYVTDDGTVCFYQWSEQVFLDANQMEAVVAAWQAWRAERKGDGK